MSSKRGFGDIISTITIAVLFLVILILVVFGASSYRHATEARSESDNDRAVLSYVITAVKDSDGKVEVRDFDGAPGISIADKQGFEQKIYMKDGRLLQEYSLRSAAIDPEEALEIGETEQFKATLAPDGILKIETGSGTSYIDTNR